MGIEKARYEKKELLWVPSATWCKQLRAEMGEMSKLHVSEWLLEGGGTAGKHCVIADGATSEGAELMAQMLSRREGDKIQVIT